MESLVLWPSNDNDAEARTAELLFTQTASGMLVWHNRRAATEWLLTNAVASVRADLEPVTVYVARLTSADCKAWRSGDGLDDLDELLARYKVEPGLWIEFPDWWVEEVGTATLPIAVATLGDRELREVLRLMIKTDQRNDPEFRSQPSRNQHE